MNKIGAYLDFHAQALALRSRRNEVLASNIANAATPNFKARDLDFDTEIRHHIGVGPLDMQLSGNLGSGSPPGSGYGTETGYVNGTGANSSWTNTGGSSGGGGSSPGSFSYDRGTISNSPTFTTSTFGDDTWVSQPSPVIVLGPDNPEQPVYSSSGSGSSGGNKTLQTLGTIASIAAPFIKCDIRVKTDISPLETTDITDDLAEVAFFVKELRECS